MTRGMIGSVTGARAVIAAVVVLLGVSACSGSDPEPKIAPPESSAPSGPSTSPVSGPTAPTMPPEAVGFDQAAVAAFVRFFLETVNYAQETGDVDELRALGRKCTGCDAGISFITAVYDKGGSITGGDGRVVDVSAGFIGKNHERAIVECIVISTKQKVDLPGTAHDRTYPGGRQSVHFILDPSEAGWVAVYMGPP